MRRLLISGTVIRRTTALVVVVLAIAAFVVAPFIAGAHNHHGPASDAKCVVCLHKTISTSPRQAALLPTATLFELGAVVSPVEIAYASVPLAENSVRAPPVV